MPSVGIGSEFKDLKTSLPIDDYIIVKGMYMAVSNSNNMSFKIGYNPSSKHPKKKDELNNSKILTIVIF